MPRSALSDTEVDAYRLRICHVATHLFAERGYEGVSMRRVANELGVTAMALYRYVESKEALLALVRAEAFRRLWEAQHAAYESTAEPMERILALGRAIVRFAMEEPDAYRIMFELGQNTSVACPELDEYGMLAWLPILNATGDAIDAGLLEGDPGMVANVMFAGIHGLLSMHLAGKLDRARSFEELLPAMIRTLTQGLAPTGPHRAPAAQDRKEKIS